MCLAIPMQLLERREFDGVADLNGIRRNVALMLTPDAIQGDWILVHAGYAITVVDSREAARTLSMLEAIDVELSEEER